jgi:hypothetical protein
VTDIRDNARKFLDTTERNESPTAERAVILVEGMLAELDRTYAEIDIAVSAVSGLARQLEAFGRDCVANGDMTPAAERMLRRILGGAE